MTLSEKLSDGTSEIFQSPSKKRDGVMSVLPEKKLDLGSARIDEKDVFIGVKESAIRRGIIKIDPGSGKVSPLKGSPGKSRSVNRKRQFEENEIEDSDSDEEAIKKIIQESKTPEKSPFNKKLMNFQQSQEEDDFVTFDGKPFKSTEVPTEAEERQLIDQYARQNELQKYSQTLFVSGPEGYFEQHKYKGKVSGNTMAQAPQLDYEEYQANLVLGETLQRQRHDYLDMFMQWYFELSEGFNVNLYGVGSKYKVVNLFVEQWLDGMPVVVINGYNPSTSMKQVADALLEVLGSGLQTLKLPSQSTELIPLLVKYLENKTQTVTMGLVIHNIDGELLRNEKSQALLALVAGLPQVWMLSTTDNINAPVLWDSEKQSRHRFVWHDITTYDSYTIENQFKDVLSLGKSDVNLGAKGAKYVLSSLTQNARNLYRVLVASQLEVLLEDVEGSVGSVHKGIEFKLLYRMCLEEFIATNEITFRILLREFIEHEMADLKRNSSGTEIVFVPLTIEELELLLAEELM